jgi:carboxylesterase type B
VLFRASGDATYNCNVKLHADALQQGADLAHSGVWSFYFDLLGSRNGTHVAHHGTEEPCIFGGSLRDPAQCSSSLRVDMAHWWYSFAAFGDPNVGSTSSLHWPEYSAGRPQSLIVDEVPFVGVTDRAKECSHWQQYLGC